MKQGLGKPQHTQVNHCPHCGAKVDAASQIGGEDAPRAGDVSLCVYCGEWNIFNEDMSIRKPTVDEYVEFGTAPEVKRVREAWVRMMENRKRNGQTIHKP